MKRLLNIYEASLLYLNINTFLRAEIKGVIHPDLLKVVLKKLQQRHPQLRVKVHYDGNSRPWFVTDDTLEIPFRIVPTTPGITWESVAMAEFNTPFREQGEVFLRVVILQRGDAFDLLMVSDHCTSDGMSLVYLLRDFLDFLGNPVKPVVIFPETPTPTLRPPPLNTHPESDPAALRRSFSEGRYTQLVPWSVPKPFFEQFMARCKQEHVSVHSGLCTACLLALPDLSGHIASAVNHRPFLKENVGESFGFYAGGVPTDLRIKTIQEFWLSAKKVSKRLKRALHSMQSLPISIPPVNTLTAQDLLRMSTSSPIEKNFTITNMGHLRIPVVYGSYQLVNVHLVASATKNSIGLGLAVSTLQHRPSFVFFFNRPAYTPSEIDSLVTKIKSIIEEAVHLPFAE